MAGMVQFPLTIYKPQVRYIFDLISIYVSIFRSFLIAPSKGQGGSVRAKLDWLLPRVSINLIVWLILPFPSWSDLTGWVKCRRWRWRVIYGNGVWVSDVRQRKYPRPQFVESCDCRDFMTIYIVVFMSGFGWSPLGTDDVYCALRQLDSGAQ